MESYVDLTQKITRTMEVAEGHVFDHEDFLRYVPQEGPWMPQMDSDMTRADPRTRYIGKGKATLVNTNIILGSSWIEAERFRYERDLKSTSDWMKQKTIMNANMWTPSTVATTQTFVFCSTGDEARMGSSYSVRGPQDFDLPDDSHMFFEPTKDGWPEWDPVLWGLGHRGVVPGSDPAERVFYPSLMHRNVTYNNRLGWVRYSPAGFGKDANGYILTRPFDWIWPAVNGSRDTPSSFNLLVNMPDRRESFGEEGITDIFLTSGKTSLYSLMGMMSSPMVRQMFGSGTDLVPLEMHMVEPGLDEWIQRASDEDRYGRIFEYCATLGYLLTDPAIGSLGEGNQRRRLIIYPQDQANLLACVSASQVADHAVKVNYGSTVFTKLDQADFENRMSRRISAYADEITPSATARGMRWVSKATFNAGDGQGIKVQTGPVVHSLLAVRGYELLNLKEYQDTFNEVSEAPRRLMTRIIQSVTMNAMKTVFPLETVQSKASEGSAPYAGLFSVEGREQPLVYYTDIRFLVPNSIDQLRMLTGQRGADRSRMREAFTELTGADPVTGLSILDLCLPFAGDMGEGTWQTGTGIRMDEVIVEVTCAVNPAAVWKHLLDCTADQTFTTVKGNKGTAANVWGDVLMQNEQLHDRFKKDGLDHWLRLLKMIYHYADHHSRKKNGL
tara:strand:- start:6244 stop:8253 length:2010 start_codon:yes stop_codon:yes gene_type:complete